MFCPNCKQSFDGKFCPECGTRLIEDPVQYGQINVNLGDANAISGGINVQDSHNITNIDNSIHNNTNITNNNTTYVAAQKTEIEYFEEKRSLFLKACKRAYEDNVLDNDEAIALEEYRLDIGLDKSTADMVLESVRQLALCTNSSTTLSPIAKIKVKQINAAILNNDVDLLSKHLEGLESLAERFSNDEVQFKYYLVLTSLQLDKSIELLEKSSVDNYWRSFWGYIAFIKAELYNEAENLLYSIADKYANYPEDNLSLLAAAGAYIQFGIETAKEYMDAVIGEYSPALQRFADTLFLLIDAQKAISTGLNEKMCAFYLVNLFRKKDPIIKPHVFENVLKKINAEKAEGCYLVRYNTKASIVGVFDLVDNGPDKGMCRYFRDDKKGIINENEQIVFEGEVGDEFGSYSEGLCRIQADDKYGYIDSQGKIVIPFAFDDAHDFSEELAGVGIEGKYGFINKLGKIVITCEFDSVSAFSSGFAAVEKDGKFGYINKLGKIVVPCIYDRAHSFDERLATVKKDGKYGYIDRHGDAIVSFELDDVSDFSEGLSYICKDDKYGYIDNTGKVVIPLLFDEAFDFSEGLAIVLKYGKYGYINNTGDFEIPCVFDYADPFLGGLAKVCKNGKFGFIDKTGVEVIPCKYENEHFFSEGLACVQQDDKYGYINKNGEVIIPFVYERAMPFSGGLAIVKKGKNYGTINLVGEEVIPCLFSDLNIIEKGWLVLEK